jgi:hypothetical protein
MEDAISEFFSSCVSLERGHYKADNEASRLSGSMYLAIAIAIALALALAMVVNPRGRARSNPTP